MLYVGRLQTAHGTRVTHRRDARLEAGGSVARVSMQRKLRRRCESRARPSRLASRMSLAATSHLNDGNVYAETVPAAASGQLLLDFLACRYTHSSREAWSVPTATRHHHSPPGHRHSPPRHRHSPPLLAAAVATANQLLHHYCRSAHGEAGRICLDAVPAA